MEWFISITNMIVKLNMEARMRLLCLPDLKYNAKHCSAWIFLVSLFGKLLCIRTKKRKEGEH